MRESVHAQAVLNRISDPAQREEVLTMLLDEFGTVEAFSKAIRESTPDASQKLDAFYADMGVLLVEMRLAAFQEALLPLTDAARWEQMANNPGQFDAELSGVLSELKRRMKIIYGVAATRPKTHSTRDAEIYKLRNKDWTFGEIGNRLNVSGKVAERAYSRYWKDERARLTRLSGAYQPSSLWFS